MSEHSATCRYPDLPRDKCGCTGPATPPASETVDAALALSKAMHDLVPGIRHDIGLVGLDALNAAGWSLVRTEADERVAALLASTAESEYMWNSVEKGYTISGEIAADLIRSVARAALDAAPEDARLERGAK